MFRLSELPLKLKKRIAERICSLTITCLTRALYVSAEENQMTDGGEETENNNSCEMEAGPGDEEERDIGAPLVLSPQRHAEVHRRLHQLQELLKRLQVRGEMKSEG